MYGHLMERHCIKTIYADNYYCTKGIDSGYLKSSPLGAFTLAMITQITLRVAIIAIIGIPMIINIKGIARTI